MIFGAKIKKRQTEKTPFDIAWDYTSANEGGDSSYDQLTKWGITAGFMSFHHLKPKMSISKISKEQAKKWVKEVISDKIFNKAERIADQYIYNLIIDFGFNKPSICIEYLGNVIDRNDDFPAAKESLKVPDSWIVELNERIKQGDAKTLYDALWNKWWNYIINSGHFKKGAPGLSMRCWRYKDYGLVGAREQKEAVKAAWEQTTNDEVRFALNLYLNPPSKNKFYDNVAPERKILFFTRKGCAACLQLKPTCEALARQNGYVFEELYADEEKNRALVIKYKIAPTPEVVLIDANGTRSFGAADLFDDKLSVYLTPPLYPRTPAQTEPDPFDDGKSAKTDSNSSFWMIPAGAAAWYMLSKRKKHIGNTKEHQKIIAGGGILLLLWFLGDKSTPTNTGGAAHGLSAKDLDDILEKSLVNEGPYEEESAHTRQDEGNFYHGDKNSTYLGTSWGITADFLEQWTGQTAFDENSIRNISKEAAKKLFVSTVMKRARISEIKDKWVASLFFDWMMQRPGTCMQY
ncbi:MAG: hypothetical protein RLZZ628_3149, partial [Bacteroidota bacterium]